MFDAEKYLEAPFIKTLPPLIREGIAKYGIRNSHILSMAPTGTISLTADNVSGGIEPVFSHEYTRTIQTEEGPIHEQVMDYAWRYFGIKGKTEVVDTSTGDATDEQILKGKKAWVDGQSITGSLGLFWGCRPDHQYWNYTDCHADCNIAVKDPPLFYCATRCSSIRTVLQDAGVSEFICAGPVADTN